MSARTPRTQPRVSGWAPPSTWLPRCTAASHRTPASISTPSESSYTRCSRARRRIRVTISRSPSSRPNAPPSRLANAPPTGRFLARSTSSCSAHSRGIFLRGRRRWRCCGRRYLQRSTAPSMRRPSSVSTVTANPRGSTRSATTRTLLPPRRRLRCLPSVRPSPPRCRPPRPAPRRRVPVSPPSLPRSGTTQTELRRAVSARSPAVSPTEVTPSWRRGGSALLIVTTFSGLAVLTGPGVANYGTYGLGGPRGTKISEPS
jgi:hypothetical protein